MNEHLLDRELSWLSFNERVLELSQEKKLNIKDKLSLFAITHSNLDEFFQIRVSGILDEIYIQNKNGLNNDEKIAYFRSIFEKATDLMKRRNEIWKNNFINELNDSSLEILNLDDLDKSEISRLEDYFVHNVMPILTPLASDQTHPFPYISDLSLSVGVFIHSKNMLEKDFVRIKVPTSLGPFCNVNKTQVVWMHELIIYFIDIMFKPYKVSEKFWFRITRDADLEFRESLKKDFLDVIQESLESRRLGRVVRIEIDEKVSIEAKNYLMNNLELDFDLFINLEKPITSFQINGISKLTNQESSWSNFNDKFSFEDDVFTSIKKGDVLVHHPYQSFDDSVIQFLRQSCFDPKVRTIKMTQYRTGQSGESDVITSLLASAARGGKQVAAQIELRARFDEEKNIENARFLEESGVHVSYGDPKYKAHVKMILVVREEEDSLVSYMHFGTGNYNYLTSQGYEDIGLFTANQQLGLDCQLIFNSLTAYADRRKASNILVAPETLQNSILELIVEQTLLGSKGYIFLKINNLTDPFIIDALQKAASNGVNINLIIRGICSLKAESNIRIISVLGQFLEHSRIYMFGQNKNSKIYIGSADMMQRNLRHRIEILVPILDATIKEYLIKLTKMYLKSDSNTWEMDSRGNWNNLNGNYSIQEKLKN